MANYYGACRSNYFAVKSEAALRKLISHCVAEDHINIFERNTPDGKLFGFGCYAGIPALRLEEDDEPDQKAFFRILKRIVADGHAIIIAEAGHEKLRYVVGDAVVITGKGIRYMSITHQALNVARVLLKNPNYDPTMWY